MAKSKFGYVYSMLTCDVCGHDLTVPGGVKIEAVTDDGRPLGEFPTVSFPTIARRANWPTPKVWFGPASTVRPNAGAAARTWGVASFSWCGPLPRSELRL
jgi:hypothetical protein